MKNSSTQSSSFSLSVKSRLFIFSILGLTGVTGAGSSSLSSRLAGRVWYSPRNVSQLFGGDGGVGKVAGGTSHCMMSTGYVSSTSALAVAGPANCRT